MPTFLEQSYQACVVTNSFQYAKKLPFEVQLYEEFLASLSEEQRALLGELEKHEEMRKEALYRQIFEFGFYAGIRCRKMVENQKLGMHEQFAKL